MFGFMARIVRETPKAVLVRPHEASAIAESEVVFWLPKSQVSIWDEDGGFVHVEVPEWLARKDERVALAIECDCGINPIALYQGAYARS